MRVLDYLNGIAEMDSCVVVLVLARLYDNGVRISSLYNIIITLPAVQYLYNRYIVLVQYSDLGVFAQRSRTRRESSSYLLVYTKLR
jgi:hypothetical protein